MPPRQATPTLLATAVLAAFAAVGPAGAVVWTVDDGGDAMFTSIQEAILVAGDGDIVQVSAGTYAEALDFCGRLVTVLGADGAEVTIIDPPDGVPAVSFIHGEGPQARLSGFTITGADTHDTKDDPGAGIHVIGSCPTLTDLVIEGNHAYFGGGIKMKFGAHALLERVVIRDNAADGCAGGIYICESSPTLIDVQVRDNVAASMNGGGVIIGKGSAPHLHRVLIEGNAAAMDGGGIYTLGVADEGLPVDALLTNVTLVGNACNMLGYGGRGANVYLYLDTRVTLRGGIVARAVGGEAIFTYAWDDGEPPLAVTYTDFHGNAGGDVISQEFGELTQVVEDEGNLTADPLFEDVDGGDFHLAPGSPAIDAGPPEAEWNDPDGSRADMGAYGGPEEVEHDTSDCTGGDDDDPCPAGDDDDDGDDDSDAVVYKKCVCDAAGAPTPPWALLLLAGAMLARRRPAWQSRGRRTPCRCDPATR